MDAIEHAPVFTLTGRVATRVSLKANSGEPQLQRPLTYTLPTSLTLDTPYSTRYSTSVPNAFTMMPTFEQQQQLPFSSIPAYATPAMLPLMHHHSPAYYASPMWSSHPHINHMHASGAHDHASSWGHAPAGARSGSCVHVMDDGCSCSLLVYVCTMLCNLKLFLLHATADCRTYCV